MTSRISKIRTSGGDSRWPRLTKLRLGGIMCARVLSPALASSPVHTTFSRSIWSLLCWAFLSGRIPHLRALFPVTRIRRSRLLRLVERCWASFSSVTLPML
ncbi:hypothetical protein M430DRAFT_182008 [Amorphotheca resinae ATCC 22711]|uniref:Uncharacterized protein n=1 Tax=Amorphotheca resinae ATCC 22711 TaxID=857342 RepID=A0A2T3ARM7_AMORE|nr:hypothetical protein M430DRAFT_182008 [Amorphotheca resinae ATCC 22711]PSS09021.1 hypothetical protein M430DRAFT_182008 [Amorphotheca resinae ATCC 22711]